MALEGLKTASKVIVLAAGLSACAHDDRSMLNKVLHPTNERLDVVGNVIAREPFRLKLKELHNNGCVLEIQRNDIKLPGETITHVVPRGVTKIVASTHTAKIPHTVGSFTTDLTGPAHLLATCTPTEVTVRFQPIYEQVKSLSATQQGNVPPTQQPERMPNFHIEIGGGARGPTSNTGNQDIRVHGQP